MDNNGLGTVKQDLSNDLLHPGRPRFGIRGDDDVVISKLEIVPDRGVKMMIVKFTSFLWYWAATHLKFLLRKLEIRHQRMGGPPYTLFDRHQF